MRTLLAIALLAVTAAPALADEPLRYEVKRDGHGKLVYVIKDPVRLYLERQAPRVQYVMPSATVQWTGGGLERRFAERVAEATRASPF